MLDSFLTFINQEKWDLANHRTLLAVSGGVDSVVMLHLFHKAGFPASVAHCNFGLRGKESDDDEQFVRVLSEQYGFSLYVKHFETKSYAKSGGISTQMAARDLRYAWFQGLARENNCTWIATAHHINDSIETTLLNLTRGTGLAGVHGIGATADRVIRPLLFASREQIHAYLEQEGLTWREDRSNGSVEYKRNLLRHRVVPLLKEINPGLEHTFKITSERLRASDYLLEEFMREWASEVLVLRGDEMLLNINMLLKASEPVYRLWFLLHNYGFSYQQAQQIIATVNGISGKIFYSENYQVLRDRNTFIVKKLQEKLGPDELKISADTGMFYQGNFSLTLTVFEVVESIQLEKDKHVAFIDSNLLKFPLTVRIWAAGDTFSPFGMAGKRKKVSDLLIDSKVSLFDKKSVRVLVNGDDEIVWVIGIRTDERFRVTDKTKVVVKIVAEDLKVSQE